MLSAVAVVLMYLEIPIPIMPGFIKFDFSDLPALLGAYALGPVAGIIICLIKNVVHLAASQSMLVGELSNFILGSVFVFTAGIVYKKKKSKTGALLGGLCGAMAMGVFSAASYHNCLSIMLVHFCAVNLRFIPGAILAAIIAASIGNVPLPQNGSTRILSPLHEQG